MGDAAGSVERMWAAFVAVRPDLAGPDTPYEAWYFCDNEADADELAQLARSGRKRATAGDLWSYEAEQAPLPKAGDLNVITDWAGNAVCVIRTISVEIVPFNEVTEEFAATEGEGDGSLRYWQEAHRAVFGRGLSAIGRTFEPDMPVVCERFKVVFGGDQGISGETTRKGRSLMITLSVKDSGRPLGEIDEADLQVLIDQLVEETEEDTDYYVNSMTIELLEQNGASARLVGLLKKAVGNSEGVDIVWQES